LNSAGVSGEGVDVVVTSPPKKEAINCNCSTREYYCKYNISRQKYSIETGHVNNLKSYLGGAYL
jgi:hypothetical protein